MIMPASRRLACWLRGLADRVDGEPRPRKPKWSHPCPVCNARGFVAPHRGQHAVAGAPAPKVSGRPPAFGPDMALIGRMGEQRAPSSGPRVAMTITAPLVEKAVADLAAVKDRTGLSETDIVNRALSLYEFVDSEMSTGAKITVRRDGSDYDIALL